MRSGGECRINNSGQFVGDMLSELGGGGNRSASSLFGDGRWYPWRWKTCGVPSKEEVLECGVGSWGTWSPQAASRRVMADDLVYRC